MVRPRCNVCKKTVTIRQDALQCDTCDNWQHRLCETGISKELYNQLVQQEEEIDFYCKECGLPAEESSIPQLPDFESTRYSTDGVHEASFSLEQSTVSTHEESHSPNQSTLDVHLPDTSEVYDQSTIVQLNNSSFTVSDEEDTTIHLNNLAQSFDITQRTFAEPDIITETSIQDDPLPDQLTDAIDQPTYSVVDGASQRGKRKLVDVDGYTYTVKKQKGDSTTWWCSVRNKTTSCSATVLQKGDNFTAGRKSHCHTANPGTVTAVKITAQAKSQARQDVFRSAGAIVETAILQHSDPSQPAGSRVKQSNLVRVVQRTKQKLRPDEPHDLEFELDLDFIPPGFLQRDIHVDSKRHLLFATTAQLTVLEKAQRWFIDGTFKIVAAPFYQLLSIHAFITANNCTKSVPLAFIVMSRRCKIDYIPVSEIIFFLFLLIYNFINLSSIIITGHISWIIIIILFFKLLL
ncbi:uncharacterized protein [Mytilus edulis]|uniref:uncharacterized protein n=1 Tax=Mytilus edulis TaxID=6550 RepID=UPI0039EE4A05